MHDTGHPDPLGHADDGVTPESDRLVALLEAVDDVLETAPCECSHKRRYEIGGHKTFCYLFDLDVARTAMLKADAAGVVVDGEGQKR